MKTDTAEQIILDLESFLKSVRLDPERVDGPRPMVQDRLDTVLDDKQDEVSTEERFISSMAAVVYNMDPEAGRFDKQTIQELVADIDQLVEDQINEVLHNPTFQRMESAWTSLDALVKATNFKANIGLSILDVTKDEAFEDLELNFADIAGSELFKKIYVAEYDQYGGEPYGAIVSLYDFANTPDDILWLRSMGKIATASHAPFVGNMSPKFLGCETMAEVAQLRDIEGMLDTPKYSGWNDLREDEVAAYIGLSMPRYIVRAPYNEETHPARGIRFVEQIRGDDDSEYLWAPSSMLFARNLVKSFESSGWCQYIRGPKGGGLVTGLPVHSFNVRGEDELRLPVEIAVPDFRELELANSGLIPLIQKKGSADAVFFSAQSIKRSHVFRDPKDSENSQLTSNLSYTFSISRIAHYLKCIMRDNIGSTADGQYVYNQIDRWISRFVTALVNPDDLTLRYYPFKAYSLTVEEIPGRVGWYHCNLSILPHIQFEGMDVDLRVDSRLG
ncbi:MAG: type VI secretion system contractile sheath large subunit [Myxococcota bacterium]